MRIIIVTIFTFFVLGILVLTTRIWGLGQHFSEFNNPFFDGDIPQIIVKVGSLSKADEILQLRPQAVLWLDVRLAKGGEPFVLPPSRDVEFLFYKEQEQKQKPTVQIMYGRKLSDYPVEQIRSFYGLVPTLKEFYVKYPKTHFILNVIDNVSDVHTILVDALKEVHPDGRTFVQSEGLVLIQAIKDLKPEWVYGTSTPDLMRFLSFDSLLVLPATQFKGDVFVAPFKIMKTTAFNENIIEEMRRRHKRIFLGPISKAEQLDIALKYKADGLITNNLSELIELQSLRQKK